MTVEPDAAAAASGSLGEMESVTTIPALRRYIGAAADAGHSLRVALAAYRAAGGQIRTEDFAAIWRDEQRKRERATT